MGAELLRALNPPKEKLEAGRVEFAVEGPEAEVTLAGGLEAEEAEKENVLAGSEAAAGTEEEEELLTPKVNLKDVAAGTDEGVSAYFSIS